MIKFVAAIFMLIDHVGLILMQDMHDMQDIYIILRVIGRLSMPMFAFALARAFRFAGNGGIFERKPYFYRLLIFAIVSQVPFYLFMGPGLNIGFTWLLFISSSLNIGFTWLLAFFLMCMITYKSAINKYLFYVGVAAVLTMSVLLPVDYGLYGVVYPAMFYYCYYKFKKPAYAFAGSALLLAIQVVLDDSHFIQAFVVLATPLVLLLENTDRTKRGTSSTDRTEGDTSRFIIFRLVIYYLSFLLLVIWVVLDNRHSIQAFAVLAAPLVLLLEKHDKKILIPRWFYYVFYPAHITILGLVKYWFFT